MGQGSSPPEGFSWTPHKALLTRMQGERPQTSPNPSLPGSPCPTSHCGFGEEK